MIFLAASSRPEGHTNQLMQYLAKSFEASYINLTEKNISYYDYEHRNEGDDFLPIIEALIEQDVIVLGTPVYWYTMSAQMKTFLDRWSDLLTIRKDLGRALAGKTLVLVSCGSDDRHIDGFDMPIRETALYMDMHYGGYFTSWMEDGEELGQGIVQNRFNLLANSIKEHLNH